MARGITEKDVFTACDALLLAGERPTIERVRQKIGRGSPNTVSPMLDAWFKGLGRRLQDPGAFAMPAGISEPVLQAAQHFWEVARAEAHHDLDAQVAAGLAEAREAVDVARRAATAAQGETAIYSSRLAALIAEGEQLRSALDSERLSHQATATKLQGALENRASLHAEVAAIQREATEARTRAEQAVAAADERGAGAERRAAMEIERERARAIRAEKATEAVTKRYEVTLREQISAVERVASVESQLADVRNAAKHREIEMQAVVDEHLAQRQRIEESLVEAVLAKERAETHAKAVQAAIERFEPLLAKPKATRATSKRATSS